MVRAFDAFFRDPRVSETYKRGGGRESNTSALEAIELAQEITGEEMLLDYASENRAGTTYDM